MSARTNNRGFTLIELMVAFCIGVLLLLMAAPSISAFLRNSEIRSTTESITNGLRVARSEAVRRNQSVSFALAGAGSASWTVRLVSDNSLLQSYVKDEGGTNVRVAIAPDGAAAVTFNAMGRILPAAAGAPANLRQMDVSSALDSGARTLRILVDETRGVRMCDPSPALAALVPPDPRAC